MICKYPNIELFKEAFFKKFPESTLIPIELLEKRVVRVKTKYGMCLCDKDNLMWYGNTNIRQAENKTEYFINKAVEIHRDKYLYTNANYTGCYTKVRVICKKHGEFLISPASHWQGVGCSKCGDDSNKSKTRKTSEQYSAEIAIIHNNNYYIKEGSYINIKTKIPHYCNIQKEWVNLRPGHVLEGKGCRKCSDLKHSEYAKINSVGWTYSKWEEKGKNSKHFESFKVYIIKCYSIDNNEVFYKIGKTFQPIDRRFQSKKEMPYNREVVKIFTGDSREMSELETKLKKDNKHNKCLPKIKFNGMYECFKQIEISNENISS